MIDLIIEIEKLQNEVNTQIDLYGEANRADADRLEQMCDQLTPEQIDVLVERYNDRVELEDELKYDMWVLEQALNNQ